MLHVTLREAGWRHYSGQFGGIHFVSGRSVGEVNPNFVKRLRNIILLDVEDDGIESNEPEQSAVLTHARVAEPVEKIEEKVMKYTREQLEQTADEQGITGLRRIADEFGLKGKSIPGLIEAILQKELLG